MTLLMGYHHHLLNKSIKLTTGANNLPFVLSMPIQSGIREAPTFNSWMTNFMDTHKLNLIRSNPVFSATLVLFPSFSLFLIPFFLLSYLVDTCMIWPVYFYH
ncbi:hypothetical protein ACJX0J_006023 [Zea mays]